MRTVLIAADLTLALAAYQAWKHRANARFGCPAARTLPGALFLLSGGMVIGLTASVALKLALRVVA